MTRLAWLTSCRPLAKVLARCLSLTRFTLQFHFTHGHAWSRDGLHWGWNGGRSAWTSTLKKADGSVETLHDAERPRVWVNPTTKLPELLFVASGGAQQPTKPGNRAFTVVQKIRTAKAPRSQATARRKCSGKCASLAECGSAPKWTDDVEPGRFTLVGEELALGKPQCLDVDAGTPHLELYPCNSQFQNGRNERFKLDAATGAFSSALYPPREACVSVCAAE